MVASRVYDTGSPEYIGREVAPMTAYEIISIFIGILALLMSFGSLIVALLAFLDKRVKYQSHPLDTVQQQPVENVKIR